jgi:proline dehydrogenase
VIEALAGLRRAGYVSIKAPALGYGRDDLLKIADFARRHDQLIHFDSHGPETADPTLEALDALRGRHKKLGLAVPGRWMRSPNDAVWATSRGVRVRVVKGQWACPDRPDADPRDGFLSVIDRLAGRASEAAVATHDAPLAREALKRLLRAGTACELELLCGLPRRDAMEVAHELRVPVRLYIPFGEAWLPYALGQILRTPKMLSWVIRDTFNAIFGPG